MVLQNMPSNYGAGIFENCVKAEDLTMGVYGTSTWRQGISPTPSAYPPHPSNSHAPPTVSVFPLTRVGRMGKGLRRSRFSRFCSNSLR
ncbi:hypothetical protein BDQ17DRAFT_1238063 [Cyathus striatus]|nr:hypothetical protein BDQ17DRAFT_1238063 [Cyathus striatus]